MSRKRISVKRILEILRLHFEQKKSLREVGESVNKSPSVVHDCLARFRAAQLKWPLEEGTSESALVNLMYAKARETGEKEKFAQPDCEKIHKELLDKKVTRALLWQEYKRDHPDDGFQYSAFCDQYRQWKKPLDAVLRREHKAGEKTFVDWSGDGIEIIDRETGEVTEAPLFVAVLGASDKTFAKAAQSRVAAHWLRLHSEMVEFFGGVTEFVVPDNEKTGVTSACYYDPELNPVYAAWAGHYDTTVMPTRPKKPRDKAKVENAVLIAQRWILAALRNHKFFNLDEANAAIALKVEEGNQRKFQKLDETRQSLFEKTDKPALRPLPLTRFEPFEWKTMTVNIDYHLLIEQHYYSVPYTLIGQRVEVRWTGMTVEILYRGKRVASHQRSFQNWKWTTVNDHRPEAHRAICDWSPQRLLEWAQKTGPKTKELIDGIIKSRSHPEQGYRASLGVLRLQKDFGQERLEKACERALLLSVCSYKAVASILKTGAEKLPAPDAQPEETALPNHENIRGPEYYH